MKLLKQFIQQETVLTAAAVLAVISAFFVPGNGPYKLMYGSIILGRSYISGLVLHSEAGEG